MTRVPEKQTKKHWAYFRRAPGTWRGFQMLRDWRFNDKMIWELASGIHPMSNTGQVNY